MEGSVNLVTSAMENVSAVFTSATGMITGNPIAMVFIGFSLAGAGVGLFRRVIRRK
jgi:hypothetical protein